jgi:hypothetical protein
MRGLIHSHLGEVAKANAAADEAIPHGNGSAGASYNLGCLPQNLGHHAGVLNMPGIEHGQASGLVAVLAC